MPVDYRTDKRYRHLTHDQVRTHYEVEHELREHILRSSRDERSQAFSWAYDELFRRVPWHPALTEDSGIANEELITQRSSTILPFLPSRSGTQVLEIGCGMGELSIALSRNGYSCVGVDVSEIRIARLKQLETDTLRFQQCEATVLPFETNAFDVVISMQLFEHLHPQDASTHLEEVYRVLKPGGYYLLETPNRLAGPRDISRFFSDTPQGFHLREYSVADLCELLSRCGFQPVQVILRRRRIIKAEIARLIELLWGLLPVSLRRRRNYGLDNPFYRAYKLNKIANV